MYTSKKRQTPGSTKPTSSHETTKIPIREDDIKQGIELNDKDIIFVQNEMKKESKRKESLDEMLEDQPLPKKGLKTGKNTMPSSTLFESKNESNEDSIEIILKDDSEFRRENNIKDNLFQSKSGESKTEPDGDDFGFRRENNIKNNLFQSRSGKSKTESDEDDIEEIVLKDDVKNEKKLIASLIKNEKDTPSLKKFLKKIKKSVQVSKCDLIDYFKDVDFYLFMELHNHTKEACELVEYFIKHNLITGKILKEDYCGSPSYNMNIQPENIAREIPFHSLLEYADKKGISVEYMDVGSITMKEITKQHTTEKEKQINSVRNKYKSKDEYKKFSGKITAHPQIGLQELRAIVPIEQTKDKELKKLLDKKLLEWKRNNKRPNYWEAMSIFKQVYGNDIIVRRPSVIADIVADYLTGAKYNPEDDKEYGYSNEMPESRGKILSYLAPELVTSNKEKNRFVRGMWDSLKDEYEKNVLNNRGEQKITPERKVSAAIIGQAHGIYDTKYKPSDHRLFGEKEDVNMLAQLQTLETKHTKENKTFQGGVIGILPMTSAAALIDDEFAYNNLRQHMLHIKLEDAPEFIAFFRKTTGLNPEPRNPYPGSPCCEFNAINIMLVTLIVMLVALVITAIIIIINSD